MSKYYFLIVLNLPLIGEVVRKYAIHSDLVFLACDLLALLTLLAHMVRGELQGRLPVLFYVMVAVVGLWIMVQQLFSTHSIGVLGVGARAMFLPIVYLYLSSTFIAKHRNALFLLFSSATIWVCVAGAMAVAQIYLGRDHPINAVWGDQNLGIGDYGGVNQEVIVGSLFRPTSIFTHTGKFGQVAFLLVLFRWCVYAFPESKHGKRSYCFIIADLITIVASGQRAAFLFLILSAFGMAWLAGRVSGKAVGRWTIGAIGISTVIAIFIGMFPQYGDALESRFISGIQDIPQRLQGNLLLPMASMLRNHLLLGEGFGYYTLGARQFGGKIIYQSAELDGFGESSLIRICGELGFVGALLFIGVFLSIYFQALRAVLSMIETRLVASCLFYVLWITSLLTWCNTADVFSNTVGTFMGYALSGAVLLANSGLEQRRREYVPTYRNLLGASSGHPQTDINPTRTTSVEPIGSRIG